MEGFNQCNNGHYYKNVLTSCPYCPKNNGTSSNSLFDKTQISNVDDDPHSKTQISGNGDFGNTKTFGNTNTPQRDLSKTFIQDTEDVDGGSFNIGAARPTRKIMGWIVSYTIESMGIDFKIYEGSNTIGRDAENTITIPDDMAVSGRHVSILCKSNKFYIKDEMAANGTFLNEKEMEVGMVYSLSDGDVIKLGTTKFKFRTSF